MRLRRLFWLIALFAFAVLPSLAGPASAAMRDHGKSVTMSDCPDHAPPPAPCPAQGTAKHAAGDCCPMMCGAIPFLPDAMTTGVPFVGHRYAPAPGASLSSLLFTKDPPPPRI
jgi:hypothetical protein